MSNLNELERLRNQVIGYKATIKSLKSIGHNALAREYEERLKRTKERLDDWEKESDE